MIYGDSAMHSEQLLNNICCVTCMPRTHYCIQGGNIGDADKSRLISLDLTIMERRNGRPVNELRYSISSIHFHV